MQAEIGNIKKRIKEMEIVKELMKNKVALGNILGGPLNKQKLEVIRLFLENKEAVFALKETVANLSQYSADDEAFCSPRKKCKCIKPLIPEHSLRKTKSATSFDTEIPLYAENSAILRGKSCHCRVFLMKLVKNIRIVVDKNIILNFNVASIMSNCLMN